VTCQGEGRTPPARIARFALRCFPPAASARPLDALWPELQTGSGEARATSSLAPTRRPAARVGPAHRLSSDVARASRRGVVRELARDRGVSHLLQARLLLAGGAGGRT
jgi:hypothetical protein